MAGFDPGLKNTKIKRYCSPHEDFRLKIDSFTVINMKIKIIIINYYTLINRFELTLILWGRWFIIKMEQTVF